MNKYILKRILLSFALMFIIRGEAFATFYEGGVQWTTTATLTSCYDTVEAINCSYDDPAVSRVCGSTVCCDTSSDITALTSSTVYLDVGDAGLDESVSAAIADEDGGDGIDTSAGGFFYNCTGTDNSTPGSAGSLDNWSCLSKSSCSTVNIITECTGSGTAACATIAGDRITGCFPGYGNCDNDLGDGCDLNFSDNGDETNTSYTGSCDLTQNDGQVACNANFLDCNGNINTGSSDGCEIEIGGTCTDATTGLTGAYDATCNGSNPPDCLVNVSGFQTGADSEYTSTDPLLWGSQFGTGEIVDLGTESLGTGTAVQVETESTVTAASHTFTDPDDIGKIIVFADGTERTILSVDSATVVTVDSTTAVSAQAFTLYNPELRVTSDGSYLSLNTTTSAPTDLASEQWTLWFDTAADLFKIRGRDELGALVDATIETATSYFTEGVTTHLSTLTNDFSIGANSLIAPFSVDEDTNTVRIGEGSAGAAADAVLSMHASDDDSGTITYTTDDAWLLEGGNVDIDASLTANTINVNSAYDLPTSAGTSGYVLKSAGGNATSWQADLGDGTITRTEIDNTDSPYTALLTDYYISVDTTTAAVTITLPDPTGNAGKVFVIKDESGTSADTGKNITITPAAGESIDGGGAGVAKIIRSAYSSLSLITDGTNWFIY